MKTAALFHAIFLFFVCDVVVHGQPLDRPANALPATPARQTDKLPEILKLELGMRGDRAELIFRDFYKKTRRELTLERSRLDPAQPTYLRFARPATFKLPDDDDIVLLFSGTASDNRLLFMSREAIFSRGHRPDMAETVKEIKKKYGAPSAVVKGTLYYFFRAGEKLNYSDGCVPAADRAAVVVPDPNIGGSYENYRTAAEAASRMAASFCDAAFVFKTQAEAIAAVPDGDLGRLLSVAIDFHNFNTATALDKAAFAKSLSRAPARVPALARAPRL
jgi:hypothetical protein